MILKIPNSNVVLSQVTAVQNLEYLQCKSYSTRSLPKTNHSRSCGPSIVEARSTFRGSCHTRDVSLWKVFSFEELWALQQTQTWTSRRRTWERVGLSATGSLSVVFGARAVAFIQDHTQGCSGMFRQDGRQSDSLRRVKTPRGEKKPLFFVNDTYVLNCFCPVPQCRRLSSVHGDDVVHLVSTLPGLLGGEGIVEASLIEGSNLGLQSDSTSDSSTTQYQYSTVPAIC